MEPWAFKKEWAGLRFFFFELFDFVFLLFVDLVLVLVFVFFVCFGLVWFFEVKMIDESLA